MALIRIIRSLLKCCIRLPILRVGIRNKIVKGKPLDKAEKEFRRSNPEYFTWNAKTVEQKEADDLARSLWNSGK